MMTKILASLGFKEEEVKVYLFLLEAGQMSVGNCAKKLGLPRPSLYGFLQRLHEKGLVTQSLERGVKQFIAESPEKVNLLFQQRREELGKQQELFETALPELTARRVSHFIKPRFQFFEGEEGMRHVLKDMLLYRDLETLALWPIKNMLDILSPDFFRYLNKERIKRRLYTRAIWPPHQVVDIKKYPYLGVGREFKREIRVAPKGVNFSMGYWMYGTKAAFVSSRRESFGFIIESAELTDLLRVQFEMFWKLSRPISVEPEAAAEFLKEVDHSAI